MKHVHQSDFMSEILEWSEECNRAVVRDRGFCARTVDIALWMHLMLRKMQRRVSALLEAAAAASIFIVLIEDQFQKPKSENEESASLDVPAQDGIDFGRIDSTLPPSCRPRTRPLKRKSAPKSSQHKHQKNGKTWKRGKKN